MNKKGQRLYIDEPDHNGLIGVRFSGRHSGHIGVIEPVYGSGASFGHKSSWLFVGLNAIGNELAARMKDTLIEQISDHVAKLEEVWGDMAGDPSPDEWTKELSYGQRVSDALHGQKVVYYDVVMYDINLGAVMMRYESDGWSDWFYWSPDTWICNKLKEGVNVSAFNNLVANVKINVEKAWADMVKRNPK